MNQAKFVYIADVYCPWCYAFAPIMKRISQENPNIPVKVYGGNLISSPTTLGEDEQNSPGLADFWRKVEGISGRNLQGAINALTNNPGARIYSPGADEILAALAKAAPGHELEQLFELEDMVYGQGLDLFTEASINQIAKKWNLNPSQFEHVLNLDSTVAKTESNLEEESQYMGEQVSYPTVILAVGNRFDTVSKGYVHYETVAARLEGAMVDLGVTPPKSHYYSRRNAGTLYNMGQ